MTSCAWLWLYAGVALMLLELVAQGFVVFFFGLAAMTVGLLRFIFGESFGDVWQIASASILTILYIVTLRKIMKKIFVGEVTTSKTDFTDEYIGRTGKVIETIKPPIAGRIEIGDSQWEATGDEELSCGEVVKVIAHDNLTMTVAKVDK